MQNLLAKGFSRRFSWSENGARVSLYRVDKYFSKFGLEVFLQPPTLLAGSGWARASWHGPREPVRQVKREML